MIGQARKPPGLAGAQVGSRLVVVGSSGAGKTWFARRIAARLRVRVVELGALHFAAGWDQVPAAVLAERKATATASGGWVLDGNFLGTMQDLAWPRADAVIWLDYPLWVCVWRLLRRTVARAWRGEELWHGKRESWRLSLASKDSVLLWPLRTFRRHRRQCEAAMRDPANAHLAIVRLRPPSEAERWLATLGAVRAVQRQRGPNRPYRA